MPDSPYILDVTTDAFEANVIQASFQHPVLVDFWAPWCGPCKTLTPILEKLTAEFAGAFVLAKVNTDEEQMLASQVGVRSLPTVVLIKDGQLLDQFTGAQPEGQVRQFLEQHIEKPAASPLEQAEELLSAGQPEQAAALMQQASEADPDDHKLKIKLASALLQTGNAEATKSILDALPAEERDSADAKAILARIHFAEIIRDAPDLKTLDQQIAADPNNLQARYLLGARHLIAGRSADALDQFFEMMQRDRSYEDDLGRRSLVDAFSIIDDKTLVARYRQRLTSLLF
jgi:putative thioredoxin